MPPTQVRNIYLVLAEFISYENGSSFSDLFFVFLINDNIWQLVFEWDPDKLWWTIISDQLKIEIESFPVKLFFVSYIPLWAMF